MLAKLKVNNLIFLDHGLFLEMLYNEIKSYMEKTDVTGTGGVSSAIVSNPSTVNPKVSFKLPCSNFDKCPKTSTLLNKSVLAISASTNSHFISKSSTIGSSADRHFNSKTRIIR
jgi:hypothetical protein